MSVAGLVEAVGELGVAIAEQEASAQIPGFTPSTIRDPLEAGSGKRTLLT